MLRTKFRALAATTTVLLLALAACDGGLTDPDGSTGQLTMVLTPTDGSADAASAVLAAGSPSAARVGLDRVESITVTLDSVQVHPLFDEDEEEGEEEEDGAPQDTAASDTTSSDTTSQGSVAAQQQGPPGDGANDGGWVTVAAAGQTVDLMALPEEGIELGSAELTAGDYRGVRLFVSDATITFSEDVQFGNPNDTDNVFEADTAHPLEIPSADRTGVKLPRLAFTVTEGDAETVDVGFDADASVRNVVATGHGTLKMSPVLVAGPRGSGGPGGAGGPGGSGGGQGGSGGGSGS